MLSEPTPGIKPIHYVGPKVPSKRELEILCLAAQGYSNEETGRLLGISKSTVKSTLVKLYPKLGASGRPHAVALALAYGWIHLRNPEPTSHVRYRTIYFEGLPLSERHLEILLLSSQGYLSKEIAQRLKLHETSVKNHMTCIFQRLGANNKTHAIALAIDYGWLQLAHTNGR